MKKGTIIGLIAGGLALIGAGIAAYKNRDKIEPLVDKALARLKKNEKPQEMICTPESGGKKKIPFEKKISKGNFFVKLTAKE